jgi:hypothetical protein
VREVSINGFSGKSIRTDWPTDIEVWCLNCAWDYGFARIDRLFEMHPIAQLTADLGRNTKWEGKHWTWLQEQHPFPIYMMEPDARIPNCQVYPLEEICEDLFKNLYRDEVMVRYLTSSASFQAAMAIHEGVDVIYVAGFEMASGSEYTYQRDGFALLVGIAMGRGIKVELSPYSDLLRAKLYGYEGGQMVLREVIQSHLDNYQAQYDAMLAEPQKTPSIYCAQGAVISLTSLLNNSDLPFHGRQGLEHMYNRYQHDLEMLMGLTNREGPEKWGPTQKQAEGAVQSYFHLIEICDLQEPDLTIQEITGFIPMEQLGTQPAAVPVLV